jgi:hypothetical protein
VLTDEQLIEQIRTDLHSGLEVLRPSRELLEAVDELTPGDGRSPRGSGQRGGSLDERRRRRVRGLGVAVPVLAAVIATVVICAVALTSLERHHSSTAGSPTAGQTSVQQRIAITSPDGNSNAFVLTPLTPGPIVRDSGSASYCCITPRYIQRDGQSIEIDNPLKTFVGKRGTFVWRARIEWVDLDGGWSVGTGTWKIVHGTGAYEHLEGHGRLAVIQGQALVGPDAEGLVHLAR